MNALERKKNQTNGQWKRPVVKGLRRDSVLLEENARRTPIRKETRSSRVLKPTSNNNNKPKAVAKSAVDTKSSTGTRIFRPVLSEDAVVAVVDCKDDDEQESEPVAVLHSIDDLNEGADDDDKSGGLEKESGSDRDLVNDSTSSQGDYETADDEESGKFSRVYSVKRKHPRWRDKPKLTAPSEIKDDLEENKSSSSFIPSLLMNFDGSTDWVEESSKACDDTMSASVDVFPSSHQQGPDGDDLPNENTITEDTCGELHSTTVGGGNDDVDLERAAFSEKIVEMENRIERLEDELRQAAAIETCLYSAVPQHGSSSYKFHTPARLLSRLYIHAYEKRNQRASVARNTVSGLIMVARTSGDDVSRLTYWLSNIVVLREMMIIGLKAETTAAAAADSVPEEKNDSPNQKLMNNLEDWHERRTFVAGLRKTESWIFHRIVDSIWRQTFSSFMQSPAEAFSNEQQGNFSTKWWENAFRDALQSLCPVRARGSDCGCLPALARMTMEECVDRLDVAIFNAILRESAHQIPTDPISDPIADPKVLPIPAGELTFGSGAQLKNSVGNWSRWLSESLKMETDHHHHHQQQQEGGFVRPICFPLLDELSDLLMTPKDMLLDHSIRSEVCPSITLPLIKRVLCNFSPDEFCPDDVPVDVLETLNAEVIAERTLSADPGCGFPYLANPVTYTPPSSPYVAQVLAGIMEPPPTGSLVLCQDNYNIWDDYEDLKNDLGSPLLASIVAETFPYVRLDSISPESQSSTRGRGNHRLNLRHELLQQVWSVTCNSGQNYL